jgi:hypothetical protein
VHQVAVSLTDAQVKALPTTVIEIIPAQGANTVIRLVNGVGIVNKSAGAYTNVTAGADGDDASISLTYSSDDNLLASNPTAPSVLVGLNNEVWIINPYIIPNLFNPVSYLGDPSPGNINNIANEGIFLQAYNSDGDYTGGNAANTLVVSVVYTVLNVLTGEFV